MYICTAPYVTYMLNRTGTGTAPYMSTVTAHIYYVVSSRGLHFRVRVQDATSHCTKGCMPGQGRFGVWDLGCGAWDEPWSLFASLGYMV
eukprot:CAMPEP_0173405902 /NCGR_PEP_ID=MMETSP1356-20130122/63079_1 /TAXON_ID=77927 ORGANISM="Hemiselmis virescens, Strain PCC157" /NCGR_SAMPLE_ID=MMETSP1356 /ASSEMBLY_ACC=CAM_ASM_000847 /LENGTH=88 /DNA_ID=CAMNT_0014366781 /DNA_START=135 /DNA_END=401 /DNA_ORIENTATION=+